MVHYDVSPEMSRWLPICDRGLKKILGHTDTASHEWAYVTCADCQKHRPATAGTVHYNVDSSVPGGWAPSCGQVKSLDSATKDWAVVTCADCQMNRPATAVVDPKAGMKFDGGKAKWFAWFSLVPWDEVRDVGEVLVVGAKKYNRDNWKYVENGQERYFDAMMRHITKRFVLGEINDPDDGLSHLAHACCDLWFLMWIDKQPKAASAEPSRAPTE